MKPFRKEIVELTKHSLMEPRVFLKYFNLKVNLYAN